MTRALLRAAAVAIAVAGLVDPTFSVATREAPRLVVAVPGDASPEALQAATRLRAGMGTAAEATVRVVAATDNAAACPPGMSCVLVGSGSAPRHVMGDGSTLVGALLDESAAPAVRLTKVEAAAEQHPAATGLLRVHVAGDALRKGVHLDVRDGDALVGDAEVAASDRASAVADVPWWPMESGPRRLVVRASSADTSDEIEIGVNVVAAAHDVVAYDLRPSWASTFVRRAIEGDPRFRVRFRSRLGPDLAVANADAIRLDAPTLAAASVVIVGGPEALTGAEVGLLERFVRVRGGSLILLPDRALSGPVARFAPDGLRERLAREPLSVGPLRATELLVAKEGSVSHALASTGDGQPAVVAVPIGDGRVILSGAMDAWRYRAGNDAAFDTFWRSLVADAAMAGGRPLDVTTAPALVAPGQDVRIELRRRSMDEERTDMRAGLVVACDGQPEATVRLWPSGRATLAGVFTSARPGACRARASAAFPQEIKAESAFVVADRRSPPVRGEAGRRLQALAAAFDARVGHVGEEETLAAMIRARMRETAGAAIDADISPMHSPWWIVPFVACLGGEWWLRRRRGMR